MANVFTFRDAPRVPDARSDYTSFSGKPTPIVIDNGAGVCRAGWAGEENPRLSFDSLVAKPRFKKDDTASAFLVGNDIDYGHLVRWALRAPQDHGIITQWDAQEHVLDHVFDRLGIDTEGAVHHPLLLTESVCNPNFARSKMSELLFECYHVPRVAYGVDSLFSLQHNQPASKDALIISSGYHATYILPFVNGRMDATHAKRIDVGGFHTTDLMLRIMLCKHMPLRNHLSFSRARELFEQHTYVASDYAETLRQWAQHDYQRAHTHVFQLPFDMPTAQTGESDARRTANTKRLQEYHQRRNEEKIGQLEQELVRLQEIQNALVSAEQGLEQMELAQQEIDNVAASLRRLRAKRAEENDDGRTMKQRREAEQEQARLHSAAMQVDEEKRLREPEVWLADVRAERQSLLDSRGRRQRHREELSKRHSEAAKKRMRLIVQQGQEESKSRDSRKKPTEDTFGKSDEDWSVYKALEFDAEEEAAEEARLQLLEQAMRLHDPEFGAQQAKPLTAEEMQRRAQEDHQLRLAVERVRVPEALFQPSMLGVDQCGVAEALGHVLSGLSLRGGSLAPCLQNIFLTGGCTQLPGFTDRIRSEVQRLLPFGSQFTVTLAADPAADAWRGAARWAAGPSYGAHSITRADFLEKGSDYLAEHAASNPLVHPIVEHGEKVVV